MWCYIIFMFFMWFYRIVMWLNLIVLSPVFSWSGSLGSKVFTTLESHRNLLTSYTWPCVAHHIPVFHHFMDLGSHLATTLSKFTRIACDRLLVYIANIVNIGKLQFEKCLKAKFLGMLLIKFRSMHAKYPTLTKIRCSGTLRMLHILLLPAMVHIMAEL